MGNSRAACLCYAGHLGSKFGGGQYLGWGDYYFIIISDDTAFLEMNTKAIEQNSKAITEMVNLLRAKVIQ